MEGFGEKGTPDSWDTAMGTVRGFRAWSLVFRLESIAAANRAAPWRSLSGWGKDGSYRAAYVPALDDRVAVTGMYGGTWNHNYTDGGLYVASCTTVFGPYCKYSLPPHTPPDPDCGCGYWAYWNGNLNIVDVPWVKHRPVEGYEIVVPMYGVIEGSGPVIIGEKGFRCAKARITDMALLTSGSCIFQQEPSFESVVTDLWNSTNSVSQVSALADGRPRPTISIAPLLEDKLGVPEAFVRETIRAAAVRCIGDKVRWHSGLAALLVNCPPDKNYGG